LFPSVFAILADSVKSQNALAAASELPNHQSWHANDNEKNEPVNYRKTTHHLYSSAYELSARAKRVQT
jgi:hypothetical protein